LKNKLRPSVQQSFRKAKAKAKAKAKEKEKVHIVGTPDYIAFEVI
jgi:hypothetical protein